MRHGEWRSGSAAVLPAALSAVGRAAACFEVPVEVTAAEDDDGVGTADGPAHTGLFETLADNGFATGVDDAGADKQVPGAEGRIGDAV